LTKVLFKITWITKNVDDWFSLLEFNSFIKTIITRKYWIEQQIIIIINVFHKHSNKGKQNILIFTVKKIQNHLHHNLINAKKEKKRFEPFNFFFIINNPSSKNKLKLFIRKTNNTINFQARNLHKPRDGWLYLIAINILMIYHLK